MKRERERVNKLLSSRALVIMNKTVGRSKLKKKKKLFERAALFLHTKVRFSNT